MKNTCLVLFCLVVLSGCCTHPAPTAAKIPIVILSTSLGSIEVRLYADKSPISVANLLAYTDAGFFNGTIFHRVMPGFMIQCGGFDADMKEKETMAPIKNEAANGLLNRRGTIAMARRSQIDSATAQFFINLQDNPTLDHTAGSFGYAVFGEVISGMDIVDKIAAVPTGSNGQHENVPVTPVVINSMKRK